MATIDLLSFAMVCSMGVVPHNGKKGFLALNLALSSREFQSPGPGQAEELSPSSITMRQEAMQLR